MRTPEGLIARIGKGDRQTNGKDGCVALALNALEPEATARWYAALGLRARDGFLDGALRAINPLSDGAIRVDSAAGTGPGAGGDGARGIELALFQAPSSRVTVGDVVQRLELVGDNANAAAGRVGAPAGGAGSVKLTDPDGRGVVVTEAAA